MRQVRWFSVLLAASLAAGFGGVAAAAGTQVKVSAQKAGIEVARRLRKLGVRGEFVTEVETALSRAAAAGPILRRGQPFVGTSFGGSWTNAGGQPGRALVTFRGQDVHVEMLGANGVIRAATSRPASASVPMQFQGTRVELWSGRGHDPSPHLHVVTSDGEVVHAVEASSSALRAWEAP